MSKRQISIDGEPYQYTIGKKFIKIWNPAGKSQVVSLPKFMGWSEEGLSKIQRQKLLTITPKHIRNFILLGSGGEPEDVSNTVCRCCGRLCPSVQRSVEPFAAEIYEKKRVVIWCEDCLDRNAMDI